MFLRLVYAGVPFEWHDPLPIGRFPIKGRHSNDPVDWTPNTILQVGLSHQRGSVLYQSHFHTCSGNGLHPISSDHTSHSLHLLGLNMVNFEALPWAPRHLPPGTLREEAGLVDWVRVTLRRERAALERVGIYQAVFLSLFRYTWDLSFFQALAERWRYVSNTVVLDDRELTIHL